LRNRAPAAGHEVGVGDCRTVRATLSFSPQPPKAMGLQKFFSKSLNGLNGAKQLNGYNVWNRPPFRKSAALERLKRLELWNGTSVLF